MADKVLFQGDDDLSEQNLTEAAARTNQTDYVSRGLGFSADFNNDTLDIGSGHAIIETSTNQAYDVFPDSRSGLSLTASDVNHVYLTIDETTDDSISYHIDTADTAPSNPSLKIGTVNTSNDSTTELNRDPSVSADDQTINNSLTYGSHDIGAILEAESGGRRVEEEIASHSDPGTSSDDSWGTYEIDDTTISWATSFSSSPTVVTGEKGASALGRHFVFGASKTDVTSRWTIYNSSSSTAKDQFVVGIGGD